MSWRGSVTFVILMTLSITNSIRADILTTQEAMNLAVAQESWLFVLAGLQENHGFDPGARFNWSGTYSSAGASFSLPNATLNGLPLALNYTGSLTGDFGQNLTWNGTWSGTLGTNHISSSETGIWTYDSAQKAYTKFDFAQNGNISDSISVGPFKRWLLKALEFVLAKVGDRFVPGLDALLLHEAMELFSNWLLKKIDPPPPTPPTPTPPPTYPLPHPTPPNPPNVSSLLDTTNNTFHAIMYAGPEDLSYPYQFETDATLHDGRVTGSTQISAVPSPHAFLLMSTGLLALGLHRRQRGRIASSSMG